MSNYLKYQFSLMFEQFYIALMFVCVGICIVSHDSTSIFGFLIWYAVYIMHHSFFTLKYFKLVYKKIDNDNIDDKENKNVWFVRLCRFIYNGI